MKSVTVLPLSKMLMSHFLVEKMFMMDAKAAVKDKSIEFSRNWNVVECTPAVHVN